MFFLLNYSYKVRATDCLCDEEKIKTRKPIRISLSSARRILTTISRCFSHSDTHTNNNNAVKIRQQTDEKRRNTQHDPLPFPKSQNFKIYVLFEKPNLDFNSSS